MKKDDDQLDWLEKEAFQLTREEDPDTSYEAAETVVPHLKRIQMVVHQVHRAHHPRGLADWELEEICGSHGATYRTRRSELVELGLLKDTGATRFVGGAKRKVWGLA